MKNTFAVKTSLFTLILALIAIATFAFSKVMNNDAGTKENEALVTSWFFIGSQSSEITDVEHWVRQNPNNPDCDPLETALPCELVVDISIDTPEELQDYFENELGDSPTQITDAAVSRKPM